MPNWATVLSQWWMCLRCPWVCLSFFSLTYSTSFSSPPPLHWQPTLFRSSYEQHDFSLSILHMLSLTKTSQNILNWFCFCSDFFFLALLFKPQRALSSHTKNTGRGIKGQLRWKRAPSSPSSLYSLHPRATCCLVHRKQSDFLCLMRKQEIKPH